MFKTKIRAFLFLVPSAGALLLMAGCATREPLGSFERGQREHPEHVSYIRNLRPYSADADHAAYSSLATVMRYWHVEAAPSVIKRAVAKYPANLETEQKLKRFAENRRLWTHLDSPSPEKLAQMIHYKVPVIARLYRNPFDPSSGYYVVIFGLDDLRQLILFYTGRKQAVAASYNDFFRVWNSAGSLTLAVCPPGFPTWKLDAGEHASRAVFYENDDRLKQAVADYEAALNLGLRSSGLYLRLGNIYRKQGNPAAETMYRNAMAADVLNGAAYNNLAYLLAEHTNKLDESVRLARQAVLLDPANPLALDTLGFALYQKAEYKEAAGVLEQARGKARRYPANIQTEIAIRLALTYLKSGQTHLVKQVLEDVHRLNPETALPQELSEFGKDSATDKN